MRFILTSRKRSIFAIFLFVAALGLHAQARPIGTMLPADVTSELAATGRAIHTGTSIPVYLPIHPASTRLQYALATERPSILVEAVFTLPRPEPTNAAAKSAELAKVYGILRSLGSLQGIQYYSASRKEMRTFYAESYIIDGPDTKNRMPDPTIPEPDKLPQSETVYAFQRDLSFGSNIYRYEYSSTQDSVTLEGTNLTRMSYGFVPVLAPNALVSRVLIVQARDALLFYVESGANAPGLLRGKLEDSFANRAEALFKWFSAKFTGSK